MIREYSYVPDNVAAFIGTAVKVVTNEDDFVVGRLIGVDDKFLHIEYPYDNSDLVHGYQCELRNVVRFVVDDSRKNEEAKEPVKPVELTTGMSSDIFKKLLDELDGNSLQTLKEKNARYSQNGDCLHNFRSGADIAGGTPAQACWGYLTKHLVALRDMVLRDDFSNREDFLEKCQDTINYVRFLWCIGNDETMTSEIFFDDIEKESIDHEKI